MKKRFTYFLGAMLIAFGLNAQILSSAKITEPILPLSPKAEVELNYDGENNDAIGTNSPAVFEVSARFTVDELSSYYGNKKISKVKYVVCTSDTAGNPWATSAKIKIYGNGTATTPGTLLAEVPADGLVTGWNEVTLPSPVLLESGDYWVGYEVTTAGGFPAGCDAGPMVSGKGGWLYFESDGWFQLSEAGLDANWNIRATLTDHTGIETELGHSSFNAFGGNGIITIDNAEGAIAEIFNLTGQLVSKVNLTKSTIVEVPEGIYIVRVENAVQKVLVQ